MWNYDRESKKNKYIILTNLILNGFADGHSVRKEFRPSRLGKEETKTIKIMESSILAVKTGWTQWILKINESKLEIIYFRNASHLGKCNITQIDVNGEQIERSDKTRYLGTHLDRTLSMKDHVESKFKTAMINQLWIKAASKFLSRKACEKLVIFLVISHLDHANALLLGVPNSTLHQLQRVQKW